jgi:hypothetical protein
MKLTPVAHDPFHRPNRKVAKASVDYSHGKPHAHCGICRHYHDHACTIVVGYIEPQMWCELFAKMQRAEGSGIPGFAEGGVPLMRTGPFPEKPEGYEFFGEPGTETKETEGFVPGVGSPAPNYDLSQIPGVGAEGVMPLESTPPESPEQQGIFKPSKYQMEPSLLEAQLGHEPVPEGLAPRIASGEVQIMDSGQFLDTTTGQIIPEEPLTRRTAGFSPVTIDPSGKPELNISKMLDISGSVGGGWVPPGAGKVLGAGIARKIAQTAEDERAIEVPHEGPKTYPEAQPTGAISGPEEIKAWQRHRERQRRPVVPYNPSKASPKSQ